MGGIVHLLLDESALTVTPSFAEIKAILKMDVKSLEEVEVMVKDEENLDENGLPTMKVHHKERKTKTRVHRLYEEFPMPGVVGTKCLRTYHGFFDDVYQLLVQEGVKVSFQDGRLQDFPKPNFSLMHGFRFSQRELLEKGLSYNRSGLLGAPTRWGKTTLIKNTVRAFDGVCTIVVAPGIDLVKQLYEDIKQAVPHLDVRMLYGGSKKTTQSRHVTVVSMDSLDKCDPCMTRLILVDEPHALPTDGRLPDFLRFERARKYGFGATLDGRFDGKDPIIRGVIGPVLAERTYLEAVQEGAIAPIKIIMLEIPIQGYNAFNRGRVQRNLLFENPQVGQAVRCLCDPAYQMWPADWQILGFIDNEKQANFISENMNGIPHQIAMAKLMTDQQRIQCMDDLKTAKTRVCFATNIYAQGVTFSDLRVVINLAGGGASTKTIQKPGRVAEIRPGKRCGVVIDFLFTGDAEQMRKMRRSACWSVVYESAARLKYYQERGFEVHVVKGYNSLRDTITRHCL